VAAVVVVVLAGVGAWRGSDAPPAAPPGEARASRTPGGDPARRLPPQLTHERPVAGPGVGADVRSATDQSLAHGRRVAALAALRELAEAERDHLYAAMLFRPEAGRMGHWWVVMNEIMTTLRRLDPDEDRYCAALAAIIGDQNDLEVPRDYAVQHLAEWLRGSEPHQFAEARANALSVLAGTLLDPTLAAGTVPGTVISTLTAAAPDLSGEERSALWSRLDPMLDAIVAGSTDAAVATRTSAIQSAAIRGRAELLPAIRELAASAGANPSVRLSSVAALGIYGKEEDRALVERIRDREPRLRFAATAALDRIAAANH